MFSRHCRMRLGIASALLVNLYGCASEKTSVATPLPPLISSDCTRTACRPSGSHATIRTASQNLDMPSAGVPYVSRASVVLYPGEVMLVRFVEDRGSLLPSFVEVTSGKPNLVPAESTHYGKP